MEVSGFSQIIEIKHGIKPFSIETYWNPWWHGDDWGSSIIYLHGPWQTLVLPTNRLPPHFGGTWRHPQAERCAWPRCPPTRVVSRCILGSHVADGVQADAGISASTCYNGDIVWICMCIYIYMYIYIYICIYICIYIYILGNTNRCGRHNAKNHPNLKQIGSINMEKPAEKTWCWFFFGLYSISSFDSHLGNCYWIMSLPNLLPLTKLDRKCGNHDLWLGTWPVKLPKNGPKHSNGSLTPIFEIWVCL